MQPALLLQRDATEPPQTARLLPAHLLLLPSCTQAWPDEVEVQGALLTDRMERVDALNLLRYMAPLSLVLLVPAGASTVHQAPPEPCVCQHCPWPKLRVMQVQSDHGSWLPSIAPAGCTSSRSRLQVLQLRERSTHQHKDLVSPPLHRCSAGMGPHCRRVAPISAKTRSDLRSMHAVLILEPGSFQLAATMARSNPWFLPFLVANAGHGVPGQPEQLSGHATHQRSHPAGKKHVVHVVQQQSMLCMSCSSKPLSTGKMAGWAHLVSCSC